MPSWLCNVRRKATEDWLTALKCGPVRTDGTVKGSPSPRHASKHQNFICTSPLAALGAHIDCLGTYLCLLVREGVVVLECSPRSDGEECWHLLTSICIRHGSFKHWWHGKLQSKLLSNIENTEYVDNDVDVDDVNVVDVDEMVETW